MKGLAKKLESLFAAVAFAEEGEFETARQVVRESERTEGQAVTGRKGVSVAMPAAKA